MKKILLTLLLLFVGFHGEPLYSQDFNKVGRTAFQFVKIGIGARQVAMGDASLAVVRDVNSIFWNPANTTGIQGTEASFSYAQWFADMNYVSSAIGFQWRSVGVFTLGFASLEYGDIPEAYAISPTGSSDTRTGTMVTGGDLLIGLGYARQFTDNLSIGVATKFLQEKLFDYSVSLFVFDVGTFYDTGVNGIRLAMSAQNFGRAVKFLDDSDREEGYDIPLLFRIGVSADIVRGENGFLNFGDDHRIALAIEAIHSNDYAERMHLGLEYWFTDLFAVRGGYRFNYDEGNLSFGFGLRPNIGGLQIRFDYAYSHFEFLDSPHRFTLSFSF